MSGRRLAVFLCGAGVLAIAASLAWWMLSFGQVWANDYITLVEASRCLVAESDICRLATSLCGARHAAVVAAYSPMLLWIGIAAAFLSILIPIDRRSMARLD